ncbi:MAG: hypothetical protein NC078_09425 [Ruminococcus sp.]|nr:hypothetical protein [Ruminococcus sp.]
MPPRFGILAGSTGFEIMPFCISGFILLIAVMTERTFRVTADKKYRTLR